MCKVLHYHPAMSHKEKLLTEIERYLRRSGMSARAFGVAAKGDPHIVYRLRKGKDITASTMDLLSNYMRGNPVPTKKKRQATDYAVA